MTLNRTRISQSVLQEEQMLPRPHFFPDLSSIKCDRYVIGGSLHHPPPLHSEHELGDIVDREWREIPTDGICTPINFTKARCFANYRPR
ncbi:hypothetical protein TNCV_2785551 [Trichonephila clavipes]|nr:hypothetical protein TNCV_2785551 [Trichonephila clavipes]